VAISRPAEGFAMALNRSPGWWIFPDGQQGQGGSDFALNEGVHFASILRILCCVADDQFGL